VGHTHPRLMETVSLPRRNDALSNTSRINVRLPTGGPLSSPPTRAHTYTPLHIGQQSHQCMCVCVWVYVYVLGEWSAISGTCFLPCGHSISNHFSTVSNACFISTVTVFSELMHSLYKMDHGIARAFTLTPSNSHTQISTKHK